MTRSAFCQLCGQRISGKSISYHHPQWPRGLALRVCQNCERNNPRCRICGLPLPGTVQPVKAALQESVGEGALVRNSLDRSGILANSGICETCRKSVKICLSCGEEIKGRYLEFDGVGPYCQNCHTQLPPCDICTAPLTKEHWLLSDGRTMCIYCHTTAVYEPGDATSLYEEMKTIVAQTLGLSLNVPTGLALVDRNQLAEVIRGVMNSTSEAGAEAGDASVPLRIPVQQLELDAQHTLGIYARKGMRRGIYIQTGLPRLLFLQVAAHEYAHAWQGENCPVLAAMSSGALSVPGDSSLPSSSIDHHLAEKRFSGKENKPGNDLNRNDELYRPVTPTIAHEGFAEWVAYKVLGHYGYRRGQERMLARTDIYGQGLRWVIELEKNCGTAGVLEACRLAFVDVGPSGAVQGCGGGEISIENPVRGQHG